MELKWSPPLSCEDVLKTPFQILEYLINADLLVSILVDYVHRAENQGLLINIDPAKGRGSKTQVTINCNGQKKTFTMNSRTQLAIAYSKKG